VAAGQALAPGRTSTSGKYPFTCLLFEKIGASLLLKVHLGINFFWILGSSSAFRLFRSYESKKVSGRFPDVGPMTIHRLLPVALTSL